MSESGDNVIAIETRFTEAPPVDWRPRDYLACRHEHTILDDVLRTVACVDCGEERLDPFEVLLHLARTWRRWHQEAEQLRKLNAEYHQNEREKWERGRDRHLGAHPDHASSFNAKVLAVGDPDRLYVGDSRSEFACERCWSIFLRFDHRWAVRRAPEPPPGKLDDPA